MKSQFYKYSEHTMKRKSILQAAGAIFASLILFHGYTIAQTTLGIGSATITSTSVTVPVTINNVAASITSFQFDLAYDATKLQYASYSTSGSIATGYSFQVNESTSGTVKVAAGGTTYLDTSAPADTTVILLTFTKSVHSGTTSYSFSNVYFNETAGTGVSGTSKLNNLPKITSASTASGNVEELFSFQVTATDADGDAVTFSFSGLPTTLTGDATGLITGTPTETGTYTVTVTATDANGESTTQTLTITIFRVNRVPAITEDPTTIAGKVGIFLTYQITATDEDGDVLAYTYSGLPPGLSGSQTGLISGSPTTGGTYAATVSVDDSNGGTASATFNFDIAGNVTPTVLNGEVSLDLIVSHYFEYRLDVSDPDSDENQLTFSYSNLPPGMTGDNSGWITGIPTTAGSYVTSIDVTDDYDNTVNTSLTFNVEENFAPVFAEDTLRVEVDVEAELEYQVTATDANNDVLTYTFTGTFPAGVTATESGLVSGIPTESGIFLIIVTASDPYDETDTAILKITVNAINHPPVFSMATATASSAPEVAFTLDAGALASDEDEGDVLTFSMTVDPETPDITIAAATGIISWTSPVTGAYTLTVTATDVEGLTATLIVTLTVSGDITPPVIVSGPAVLGVTTTSATIEFNTDESASSMIGYKTSVSTEVFTYVDGTTLTTSHLVEITGLEANTSYVYSIIITNAVGLADTVTGDFFIFKTLAALDETGPLFMSGPFAVNISDNTATIIWGTDEASTSVVYYGLSATFTDSVVSADLTTAHSVALSGLTEGTAYFFSVASIDASGNRSLSETLEFTTKTIADVIPPIVIQGPIDQGITTDRATIVWYTDELSTSKVIYKPENGLTYLTKEITDLVDFHSVTLTDLTSATTYEYTVTSVDAFDNTFVSETFMFTTETEADETAPLILAGPDAIAITDNFATIIWTTNEEGDSYVDYGTTTDYGSVAGSPTGVTEHSIQLTKLEAGTEYHFRVRTADASLNTVLSDDYTFTTEAAADTDGPVFVTQPYPSSVSENSATIEWEADEPNYAVVNFGLTSSLGGFIIDQNFDIKHCITLSNLESDTTYYYTVSSTDLSGNETVSSVATFRTKAERDETAPIFIQRPIVKSVTVNSALIFWVTDELSDTKVEYDTTSTFTTKSVKSSDMITDHLVQLTNLLPDKKYYYRVVSKDFNGNTLTSSIFDFTTEEEEDITPPVITTTPFVSNTTNSTAIIEWATDENSTSVVEYSTESGTDFETTKKSVKILKLETYHKVTLTNLTPGTRYYFKVISSDINRNAVSSGTELLSFYTKAAADVTPPTIIAFPYVVSKTHQSVIIEWKTDEPANSFVEYGTDTNYLLGPKGNAAPKIDHRIVLTNLSPGTKYYAYVRSTDHNGNTVTTEAAPLEFTMEALAVVAAPKILSGPDAAAVSQSSATIVWITDKPSDSYVFYGTSKQSLTSIEGDPALTKNHKIVLVGLTANTRYHFTVSSSDIDGNKVEATRIDYNFRTAAAADDIAPKIIAGPIVYATEKAASFEWVTDEAATTVVYFIKAGATAAPEKMVDPALSRKHSITVSGLELGTQYYFAIASSDATGNTVVYPEDRPSELAVLYKMLGEHAVAQPPGGFGSFYTNSQVDATAPNIIEGPKIVSKTSSSVTVLWKTDERSNSFVDYGETSVYSSRVGDNSSTIDHTIILTNLDAGKTYNFSVLSSDLNNNGPVSSSNMAVTTTSEVDDLPPVITAGPTVGSKTVDQVTIIWDTDEQSDTKIEFSTGQEFFTDENAVREVRSDPSDVTNHSITITNLQPNTTYYYRVSSVDLSDNGPTYGPEASFTTAAEADVTGPQITAGPSVTSITNTKATITWKTDETSNSYVEFGTSSTSLPDSKGDIAFATDHAITLTNLSAGVTYYFKVGSTDQFGNASDMSAVTSFETALVADTTPPEVPANVAVLGGDGASYISWDAITDAAGDLTGYNIYRKSTGEYSLVASNIDEVFYCDCGLTNGTTYIYKVTSVDNSANESAATAEVTATPSSALVPGKPVLSIPAEGSVVSSTKKPTFTVTNAASNRQPVTYEFVIASDASFLNVVKYAVGITQGTATTNYAIDVDLADGSYYWRVRAHDGYFAGSWSDPGSFSVAYVTAVELLSFGALQEEAVVKLTWETVFESGNTYFKMYRSPQKDEGFEELDIEIVPRKDNVYVMLDESVDVGKTYYYKLKSEDEFGYSETLAETNILVAAPRTYKLYGNYPNPFNPETTIKFELPVYTKVKLTVYNILGQEVATLINEERAAGFHAIKWDGRNAFGRRVASGIYIYRLEAKDFVRSKKMLMVK